MSRGKWIGFVANRYIFSERKTSAGSVFSVLGIATGVLALIVIIAVMNGFQLGFIESILEISSAHIRLEGSFLAEDNIDEIIMDLRNIPEIVSVLPYSEQNLLIRGLSSNPRGALIRGMPLDALNLDPGMADRLEFEGGFFDLYERGNIILGAELARHLFVWVGDEISLLSISGGIGADMDGGSPLFRVSGIFRSGFYEFDLGWAYVSMEDAAMLSDNLAGAVLGIKIRNRWQDQRAMEEIRMLLSSHIQDEGNFSISSWRDYNRAFFGALRTEKLMMFILLGLIFIVVGLNIYQAQRRAVLERREEIGLLRALGASDISVRLVFVWDGFIIGIIGAGIGLGLGLLTAINIPSVFSFLEDLVNLIIKGVNGIAVFFGASGSQGNFSIFSPQIFYIKEIPSRLIFHEVLLIFLFGFLSALIAAWFASGKTSGLKPAEVLRYE